MKCKISRLAVICGFILFSSVAGGTPVSATTNPDAMPPASQEEAQQLTISLKLPSSSAVEQVPLFSEKYAQTPVAIVNGEPITLREFAEQLVAMHGDMEQPGTQERQDFTALLDRLIAIKLVVQESVNIGFDQTPTVQKQLEEFALKTLITQLLRNQLQGMQADEKKVDELYKQMALEAKLLTYKFQNQADAQAVLDQYKDGGDFKQLAQEMVEKGKAEGGSEADYIKLKDLLPSVAQAAFSMKIGEVSEIFRADKGFLFFKLEDRRGYEDPDARMQATQMVLEQQGREKQEKYLKELEQKYVTMDKEAEEQLNFEKIMKENPETKAADILAKLRNDKRPLATIKSNEGTTVITVAEVAQDLEASFYHGTDKATIPQEIDAKKATILKDKLVRVIGAIEARSQGIDKTEEYLNAVNRHREKVLFDTFMSRAVLPDVKVTQAEAREYYQTNIAVFSTPLMLKMKSLAFLDEKNAQNALRKLKAGSDFKWVSGNVTGLAAEDDKSILNFSGNLLAITALPADLQKMVDNARAGDMFLYNDPAALTYVLVVESAFPPQAKPYDEVKTDAAKAVYGRKVKEALDDYVGKLKEAYETEIFIVNENN